MRASLYFTLATMGVGLASTGSAGAQTAEPEFVVVQFDTVEVEPLRPTGVSWDGAKEESGGDCGFLSFLGAGAAMLIGAPPSIGSAAGNIACKASEPGQQQQERDPCAPDLIIRLSTGTSSYYTPVAWDAYSHDFAYKIIVPLAAIPAHGLKLAVLDQDGAEAAQGEILGSFRLNRDELLDGKLHILKGGSVKSLEMSASPFQQTTSLANVDADSRKGLTPTTVKVLAGQLVRVKASGEPSVRSFDSQTMGPKGYPARFRSSNIQREPFKSGPHAAAVALTVADEATVGGIVVGECAIFIAPFSGTMVVGINDIDVGNNGGSFKFEIELLGSDLARWSQPGARLACSQAPAASADTTASDAPLIREADGRWVSKELSRKQIIDGMTPVLTGAKACADEHGGKTIVKVKIRIGPDGKVTSAQASGESDDLSQCITEKVKGATFSKTEKGMTVVYPFVFR